MNMNDEQRIRWDDSFKAGKDYTPFNEVLLNEILKDINHKEKNALDLGCGTGDAVLKIAERGMSVTGTDWSNEALEKAQSRINVTDYKNQIKFIQTDLNELANAKLQTGIFDFVLCKLVIAFMEDKKLFCQTVKSLLSPDGIFVIQTPVLHGGINYTPEDKPKIAVNYEEFLILLNGVFESVLEFNHSYYGERGDLVTFIVRNTRLKQ